MEFLGNYNRKDLRNELEKIEDEKIYQPIVNVLRKYDYDDLSSEFVTSYQVDYRYVGNLDDSSDRVYVNDDRLRILFTLSSLPNELLPLLLRLENNILSEIIDIQLLSDKIVFVLNLTTRHLINEKEQWNIRNQVL